MSDIISPTPNEVLQALLNAHGYDAQIKAGRVVVPGYEAQWSSDVYFRSQDGPAHLQLDVRVHLPDGRTLVESCSGIGRTLKYALGDGFDSFSRSSFHVLLNAFFAHPHDVSTEEWQLPSGRFTVFIGNATFRGKPSVEGEEYIAWFETFANLIQQSRLNFNQSHWLRLYYAQHKGQTTACEILLDNEPWKRVQEEMASISWPRSEAFYSTRIFLVLRPNKELGV